MEKNKKTNKLGWILLSTGIILGFILGSKLQCGNISDLGKGTNIVYFPKDTIRDTVPKYIYDTITKYIPVKPHITEYSDQMEEDTFGFSLRDSTLYYYDLISPLKIDTANKPTSSTFYSYKFLKTYPKDPKIHRSRISKHSYSMDLLYPSGPFKSLSYPIDLDNYSYVWEENQLKAIPLLIPKKPLKKLYSEGYTTFSYNPFRNSSQLELEGSIYFGNWGLTSYIQYLTNTKPPVFFGLGTKVKLWGEKKNN